jgi:2,3-bisphosphoglycerate-independent phosphoglycerate mutase
MMDYGFLCDLVAPSSTKMVLLVMDGLGGLPHPETGLSELETARTPHLDSLARASICGLVHPVAPGITPGSGPGHLALFGYDPFRYGIGRGVLAAIGSGVDLAPDDLAARVNFCTIKDDVIADRRAGRISTEENSRLCAKLKGIVLGEVKASIYPEKEHRAALVFSGLDLSEEVTDTDPQRSGLAPLPCKAKPGAGAGARKTAELVNSYLDKASEILAAESPANMIITRGFSKLPLLPDFNELHGVKAMGIANYPMYRAVAKLVGMEVPEVGDPFSQKVALLERNWERYDYFFIHYKHTDSAGEDGDFRAKVEYIEEVEAEIPSIRALQPDVLAVTGDHSTPALLKSHSWHPCPILLHSSWERYDEVESFGESACARGGLGIFRAIELMPMMLANALRLKKFGA